MSNRITSGRSIVLAGLAAGSMLIGVSSAVAGGCPGDKMKADVRQPATHAAKGVTDTVLAAIDLEKEPTNIKERQLRFRKLTIEPCGGVPWSYKPSLTSVSASVWYNCARTNGCSEDSSTTALSARSKMLVSSC